MLAHLLQILRLSPDAFHNFMFSRLSLASSGLQGLSFLENLASVEVSQHSAGEHVYWPK